MPADPRARAVRRACATHEDALPAYIEACLVGMDAAARFPELYRHLAQCRACAFLVAETVSVIRWRDAQEPFNALVPPAAAPINPTGFTGGSPRAH